MGAKNFEEITYKLMDGVDHIIEEKADTFIALRKVAWGNKEEGKMDIRNWYFKDEKECPGKGVTLTDDGCNNLTHALLQEGFGETEEILFNIKERKDFIPSVTKVLKGTGEELDLDIDTVDPEEEFYEVEELFD